MYVTSCSEPWPRTITRLWQNKSPGAQWGDSGCARADREQKTTCPVPGLLWQRGYQARLWSRRKAGGNANSILNDSLCTVCVKWLSAKLKGLSAHSDVYYMKRCQTHRPKMTMKGVLEKTGQFLSCLVVPPGFSEKDRKWEGELQAGFRHCGPSFSFWNEKPGWA